MDYEHLHPVLRAMSASWPIVRIDDLFAIEQGKQVSARHRDGDRQRPFLRTKNVYWGRLDLTELDAMHFSEEDERRLRLLPGDLLTCEGGWVGRTAIWNGEVAECLYQNHLHRLRRISGETDPRFALYWLWYAFEIGEIYFGRQNVTTIPNLSKSRLGELPMPSPSGDEQRQIAAVLFAVQSAIERQQRLIALTAELKKALMHKLFTEGTRGGPLKQTEIGSMPRSWTVTELAQVCEPPQYGYTTSAATTGNAQILRITDIQEAGVNWATVPHCNCSPDDLEKYRLVDGDLVFARIGATTGKNFLVREPPQDAVFASYLIRVRPRADLDSRFLAYFCQTEPYWRQIAASKGNNLKGGFNSSLLRRMLIPLPPEPGEQKQIADVLGALDRKIGVARRTAGVLHAGFGTLLHQLMTAQIRVHEIDLTALELEEAAQPAGAG